MPDASGNLLSTDEGYIKPGTGLINVSPGQTNVTPSTTPSVGYTPATANPTNAAAKSYDPTGVVVVDDDTVQGQLDKVLAKDSKLLQRADVRSRQNFAGSGMINSSMALQAGQAAVIDAAMPIAQQDAQTNFTANTKTVDAQNAAKNFGAAAENQTSLANAQLGTDVSKTNAGMINEANARASQAANEQMVARLDATTRTNIAQLDATTRTALATMDAQNRQLLQTSQSAAEMFRQTVTDITNISMNEKMTKEAKDAAVQTALNLLREGLGVSADVAKNQVQALADLDIGQYFLNETDAPATPGTPSTPGTPANPNTPIVQQPVTPPGLPDINYVAGQLNSHDTYPVPTKSHPQPWIWDNRGRGWR